MRPGQLPRKKRLVWKKSNEASSGFNEAGAIAPEKTNRSARPRRAGLCFNEAGAIAPEKTLGLPDTATPDEMLQ